MTTVAMLLEKKNAGVLSVTPDSSVYDALKLMAEKGVGAVVVLAIGVGLAEPPTP